MTGATGSTGSRSPRDAFTTKRQLDGAGASVTGDIDDGAALVMEVTSHPIAPPDLSAESPEDEIRRANAAALDAMVSAARPPMAPPAIGGAPSVGDEADAPPIDSADAPLKADVSIDGRPGDTRPGITKTGEIISTIGVPIEIGVDKNGKPKISIADCSNLSRAEKIELGMNIAAVALASGAGDRSKKPWVFTVKIDDWQLRAAVTGQLEALGHKVKGPKSDVMNNEAAEYNKKYGPSILGGYARYSREVNHIKETVRRQCAKSSPAFTTEYNPDSPKFFNNPDNIAAGFVQRFFKGIKDSEVLTQDKILRRIVTPAVFNPSAAKARKRFANRLQEYGGEKLLNPNQTFDQRIDLIGEKGLFLGNGWEYTLPDAEKIKTAKGANEELERIAKDLAASAKPRATPAIEPRPMGPSA